MMMLYFKDKLFMNHKAKIISIAAVTVMLVSGCASEQKRLNACTAKGVSIDTCYKVEKDRSLYREKVIDKQLDSWAK